MPTTLLRLGLWTVILVLALYVLKETYPDQPFGEMIQASMLQQILVVAVAVIAVGVVMRLFGKGAEAVNKNRCRVCRAPIVSGALYCREHLRNILHDEEDKTHASRVRR